MSRARVEVGGRRLQVTNLDKVLYPASGTTKAEVLRYYLGVAEVLLPHLAGRPVTFRRFPDGVEHDGFFEKRCPSHRPDWVGTIRLGEEGRDADDGRGGRGAVIDHCAIDDVAALAWAANLAALELHLPMGRAPDPTAPTAVVFDLDPGAPADVTTCCEVALLLRELCDQLGLTVVPKTSGSKGLQLHVPVDPDATTYADTRRFARAVAELFAARHPALVVATQTRSERVGKVLIDWGQNGRTRTTIGVYSLRATSRPQVSTPLTWEEVAAGVGADAATLVFGIDDVLARVTADGDRFADCLVPTQRLPAFGAA